MNIIKTMYSELPETITIPKEYVHKKGQIIIILDESIQDLNKKSLKDFYGTIPDFPERAFQGIYDNREEL